MNKFPPIKTVVLDLLIPYARNSRTHSDEQISQIAASIKEFGFLNPVIIDGDNGIIAGHGRVMAAKKLGMAEAPCIDAGHLTQAQRRAYVIADNKLALNAGWDEEMLRVEFEELAAVDFDIGLTGFAPDEILAINHEPMDIDEVDQFNDTFNISISCDDLAELAMIQQTLGITGKKIKAGDILARLQDD